MSIKKNFGYNLILTFTNYLFPLLVYPYVSRVLKVDNIGICSFIDNVINYFVLFSLAGISSFGVREIARCRDNRQRLDTVFSSLVTINIILTLVALAVLVVAIYTVPQFSAYKPFLWLGALKLVFNIFLVEWFVQGMQLFKYITIRTIVIRFIYVVCVFIFVRTQRDLLVYFALMMGVTVANAIVNWNYIRHFVSFRMSNLTFRPLLKPIASFGYYRILTSFYTTFNIVFLGFIATDTQVGYFSTASKLNGIIMSVFSAFTTVMVPHVAFLIKDGEYKQLQAMADKIFRILLICGLPVVMFALIFAEQIIFAISGPGYEGACTPFRIIIPLILVIGFEQILVQQFLMAVNNSQKAIVLLSTVGAVVGLTLNFLLTPHFSSVGSSISWVASEVSILALSVVMVRRIFKLRFQVGSYAQILLVSVLFVVPCVVAKATIANIWISLVVAAVATAALFLLLNHCYYHLDFKLKR